MLITTTYRWITKKGPDGKLKYGEKHISSKDAYDKYIKEIAICDGGELDLIDCSELEN